MNPLPATHADLLRSVLSRSTKTESGCLEFQGAKIRGYAAVGNREVRTAYGHRVVMEAHLGYRLDPKTIVRHKCDNPPCVELSHLECGSQADNVADMMSRGRYSKDFTRWKRGEDHKNAKVAADEVVAMRKKYDRLVAGGPIKGAAMQVADEYPYRYETVWRIVTRRAWRHLP